MKNTSLVLLIIFFISCRKKDEEKDTTLPTIVVAAPSNNQVFSAGQTVSISASITDNRMLEEIHLEIINNNTGTFVTHEHFSPGAANYTLSKTFTAQASTSYKIKIEADDDSDNVARTELTISAN